MDWIKRWGLTDWLRLDTIDFAFWFFFSLFDCSMVIEIKMVFLIAIFCYLLGFDRKKGKERKKELMHFWMRHLNNFFSLSVIFFFFFFCPNFSSHFSFHFFHLFLVFLFSLLASVFFNFRSYRKLFTSINFNRSKVQ